MFYPQELRKCMSCGKMWWTSDTHISSWEQHFQKWYLPYKYCDNASEKCLWVTYQWLIHKNYENRCHVVKCDGLILTSPVWKTYFQKWYLPYKQCDNASEKCLCETWRWLTYRNYENGCHVVKCDGLIRTSQADKNIFRSDIFHTYIVDYMPPSMHIECYCSVTTKR